MEMTRLRLLEEMLTLTELSTVTSLPDTYWIFMDPGISNKNG